MINFAFLFTLVKFYSLISICICNLGGSQISGIWGISTSPNQRTWEAQSYSLEIWVSNCACFAGTTRSSSRFLKIWTVLSFRIFTSSGIPTIHHFFKQYPVQCLCVVLQMTESPTPTINVHAPQSAKYQDLRRSTTNLTRDLNMVSVFFSLKFARKHLLSSG